MTTGIYKIENTVTGKVYIGLSTYVERRLKQHKMQLRLDKHYNKGLQSDYNSYGPEFFSFELLEPCKDKSLADKENYWMEKYNALDGAYGYNRVGGTRLGPAGKKHGLYKPEKYTIYHYKGSKIENVTLFEMTRMYGLPDKMRELLSGESKSVQGFKLEPWETNNYYFKDGTCAAGVTYREFREDYNKEGKYYFVGREAYDAWANKNKIVDYQGNVMVSGYNVREMGERVGVGYVTISRLVNKSPLSKADSIKWRKKMKLTNPMNLTSAGTF